MYAQSAPNFLNKKLIKIRIRQKVVFGVYIEIKPLYEKELRDRWTFGRVFFLVEISVLRKQTLRHAVSTAKQRFVYG